MKQEEPSSTQRQVNAQGRPEQVASKEGILPACSLWIFPSLDLGDHALRVGWNPCPGGKLCSAGAPGIFHYDLASGTVRSVSSGAMYPGGNTDLETFSAVQQRLQRDVSLRRLLYPACNCFTIVPIWVKFIQAWGSLHLRAI